MRAKLLLAVALLSGGLLVLAAWLSGGADRRAPSATQPLETTVAPLSVPDTPREAPGPDSTNALPTAAPSPQETNAPAAVSPDYPKHILSGLVDPDREVRRTALADAVQLEDLSIVPRLRELADSAEDPGEKAEIAAAIDFINLPSVTEVLAEQKAARNAAGIPDPPQALTNRWTGRPFRSSAAVPPRQ